MDELIKALNRIADELHAANMKLDQELPDIIAQILSDQIWEHCQKREVVNEKSKRQV